MFESSQIYPYVVRPGKPRVQTIYQFRATLARGESTKHRVRDRAIELILRWITNKYPATIPPQAFDGEGFDLPVHGQKLECVSLPEQGIWSVLLEQPDAPMGDHQPVPGRVWSTEIALRISEEVEFAIRVNCASLEYSNRAIKLTRPRIVVDLATDIGMNKIRPICSDVWFIENTTDLHNLYNLLQDEKRFLPVVLLTETQPAFYDVEVHRFLVDEVKLGKRALGYAYVAALTNEMTKYWTTAVGKQWTAYNGAVRTYYPGLNLDEDNPFLHPRVLPDKILFWKSNGEQSEEAFSRFLINKIASRNTREQMVWGKLIFLREAKALLRANERERAEMRLNDIVARTEANEELRKRIDEMRIAHRQELQEANERAESWLRESEKFNDDAMDAQKRKREVLEENFVLRSRIDQLQYDLERKTGESVDANIPIPGTYDEMPDWIRKQLAGRLLLHNRALQGIKKAEYEKVELVYRCLLCLANEYRSMRLEGHGRENFEQKILSLEVEDRPAISDTSAGTLGDEYDIRYPEHSSKKRRMERHLCKGVRREPKYTLRIYYFWDEETKQVVVGWLPSHLETRDS